MSSRQIARLALGITGIWCLIYALSGMMGIAAVLVFQGRASLPTAVAELAPTGVLLALGYVLVFHNDQASTVIFPDFSTEPAFASSDLSRILVCLTGILILGSAIPSSIGALMGIITSGAVPGTSSRPLVQALVGHLVQGVFGLYLIVRPQRLLDYLRRASEHAVTDAGADVDTGADSPAIP